MQQHPPPRRRIPRPRRALSSAVALASLALASLFLPRVQALVASATVAQPHEQLVAQVLPPTGLARGALLEYSFRYILANASSSSSGSLSAAAAPPLLLLADGAQLARHFRRAGGPKDGGDDEGGYYQEACLAPTALRVELTGDGADGALSGGGGGAFRVPYTGQFALLLLQCAPAGFPEQVAIAVNATSRNPDAAGRLVHQLGLESLALPRVYGALLAAALLLLLGWGGAVVAPARAHATAIHTGFALALAVKVVELAALAKFFMVMDHAGEASRLLRMGVDLIQRLSMLAQLLLLLLLALGWKVTRDRLSPREARLLSLAFGSYTVVCASQAACNANDAAGGGGTAGRFCQAWGLSEYVLQSLILLGIIVSVNWNITALRAYLADFPWSSLVPVHYKHLSQLAFFRWLFLLFLLLPTLLLVVRTMLIAWPYAGWVEPLLRQCLFLAIYVALALAFAPFDKELFRRPFSIEPGRGRADAAAPARGGGGGGGGAGNGGM